MKIGKLSAQAQEGLRRWAADVHDDELLFDAIGGNPEQWAWIYFQLQACEDSPEWFPKGRWATIQAIGMFLLEEATVEMSLAAPTKRPE
jgi:hypothetical protein